MRWYQPWYQSCKGLLTSSDESPVRLVTIDRRAPKIFDGEGSSLSLESSRSLYCTSVTDRRK